MNDPWGLFLVNMEPTDLLIISTPKKFYFKITYSLEYKSLLMFLVFRDITGIILEWLSK